MDTQFMPVDLNPAATEDAARHTPANREVLRAFTPTPDQDADLFAPLAPASEGDDSLRDFVDDNFQDVLPPAVPASAEAAIVSQPAVQPVVEENVPEVEEYDDGSSLTIESGNFKKSAKWKATLDSGDGRQPEVFYGKTKDEMWKEVAVGKMNATKEIRKLNKKVKLGVVEAIAQPEAPLPTPQVNTLTADDIFQIKTKLQDNPDLAFETWFQKKTGLTVNQLVDMAQQGQKAMKELDSEAIAKAFMEEHNDYVATDDNYESILAYLAKHKLGIALNDRNKSSLADQLVIKGHWTLHNLNEAYEDLTDAGLLELSSTADDEPDPVPVPTPPRTPRIASTQVQPRQNAAHGRYGLRPGTVTTPTTPADTNRAPSAEELDALPTEEIQKLFSGVRRLKAQTARR